LRKWVASSRLLPADLRRKLQHTLLGRAPGVQSLYLDNFYSAFSADEQRSLLNGREAWDFESAYHSFWHYWESRSSAPVLERLLYTDQKTYLVELLMKQDQMSMACSIESRVPFLDHPMVEFAAQVPQHLKVRGSVGKYILKKAVEDLLPYDIVYRAKMGFPTPLRRWLRQPEAAPLFARLIQRGGAADECLDLNGVNALIERHRSGLEDHTERIWRLLNLQLWWELFMRGSQSADEMGREMLERAR
jgi:asparagine synthase (glutamine-hydrolysing)